MNKRAIVVSILLGIVLLAVGAFAEVTLKTRTGWSFLIIGSGSVLIGSVMARTINWLLRGKPRWKLMFFLGIAVALVGQIIEVFQGTKIWWVVFIQWFGYAWTSSIVVDWVHTPKKQKSSSGD